MSSRIYLEDIDVVKMFIEEWMESLKGLEKEILKLEVCSEDTELINDIYRRAHSIKGGSSFVGLSIITSLSYEVEVTLDAIRKRDITVNTELIDSLLLLVDFLNTYIANLLSKIKEQGTTDENEIFIDFINEQNENSVLERLKIAHEKCKKLELNTSVSEGEPKEEVELDILQTEEFKNGLAEGMKEQFLLESTEHIERIENYLLIELDKNSDNREAINDIFRSVHSIKGGTGIYLSALSAKNPLFSGLRKFSEVVHNFESLLVLVRDKVISFDKSLIDLSYSVTDYFKAFINAVDANDNIDLNEIEILGKIGASIVCIESGSCYISQKVLPITPEVSEKNSL
ncbi:Hpt domain-containing protein [Ruminiclostridium herbifermentans]|uniref:Hpt domain-containing protein n=1 Tax=Ruminiclostridium herbifermentans TaxID=2488810 RepID=A0A4V6EP42_9FIRM|nr:Hpt domain-containing protein [Ruminiclostridium herbifermentans]QNU66128.1 Hpt domain-containing protein [Ruminiclostridium herbifermentans]